MVDVLTPCTATQSGETQKELQDPEGSQKTIATLASLRHVEVMAPMSSDVREERWTRLLVLEGEELEGLQPVFVLASEYQ